MGNKEYFLKEQQARLDFIVEFNFKDFVAIACS